MKVLIVIPSRKGSTRFLNKPMAMVSNHTLIERVWKIAYSVKNAHRVIIATDDVEIQTHALAFGAEVILTGPCDSGTDRVAEVVSNLKENYSIIINLQGDAVLTPPSVIEKVIDTMLQNPKISIATPMVKLKGESLKNFVHSKTQGSSTGTTVVFDLNFNALYFSKNIIPYERKKLSNSEIFRHIGLYGYRPTCLLELSAMQPSPLEIIEGLEQLRPLQNGIPIKMVEVDLGNRTCFSIDNPEDVAIAESLIRQEGELV